ncbi:MAG: flagellar assembly protein FliW [candidate division Zixibacteria bacterium]|nr:flagellar assembly protein FliW [candidate division Zixibacteria bacterium]
MKYLTSRFGEISFEEKDILFLPKGILGFSQLSRYVIIEKSEYDPFRGLQSVEDPDVTFVMVDPTLFFPNYKLEVNEKELEELNFQQMKELDTYVIVTVLPDLSQSSADLLGPLVINSKKRIAKQVVMPDSPYTTKHYILDELKKQLKRKRFAEEKNSPN